MTTKVVHSEFAGAITMHVRVRFPAPVQMTEEFINQRAPWKIHLTRAIAQADAGEGDYFEDGESFLNSLR